MSARLVFLGTGGDCHVVGRDIRSSGGIVLKVGKTQIHIDPGPGALSAARKFGINLRENTAVLVSHAHTNHSNDVGAVISAMTYNGLDAKGVIIGNKTFINGSNEEQPGLSNFHKQCVEKIITLSPGQKIGINNSEVVGLNAIHSDVDALGFKVVTPHFVIGYTGDTKYSSELIEQYKYCDILIMNTPFPSGSGEETHLSTDDAIKILSKASPSVAIITHFGNKMLGADPISEARVIQKATGIQCLAARDGFDIDPKSYSELMNNYQLNLD